jgi:hypothetical protein
MQAVLRESFRDGSDLIDISQTVTADAEQVYSPVSSIPADGHFYQIPIAFISTHLQFCYLYSDQNLVVLTNFEAPTSGGNIIHLLAGVPLLWITGGYFSTPFPDTVTSMWVQNNGTVAANPEFRFGVNEGS